MIKQESGLTMSNGFTRQETMILTGLTSNQLSYLDRTDLVTPRKEGHPRHPKITYSAEQILEIQLIKKLREKVSPKEVESALDYLKSKDYDPPLLNVRLLSFNKNLYWIKNEENLKSLIMELVEKNKGEIVMLTIEPIGDVISEIWEERRKSRVLDFEKRIKGTALEVKRSP